MRAGPSGEIGFIGRDNVGKKENLQIDFTVHALGLWASSFSKCFAPRSYIIVKNFYNVVFDGGQSRLSLHPQGDQFVFGF